MLTDDLPEKRKNHPFVMYDMLKDIPNGIKATINKTSDIKIDPAKKPFYFTGNGTAYHAAIAGAQLHDRKDGIMRFVQAYELENFYKPEGTIIAFSHTGKTKSTVDAVKKHRSRTYTIGISHYDHSPLFQVSDLPVLIGNSPDLSLCNTKAFFDNAFSAMIFAAKIYGEESGAESLAQRLVSQVPGIERQVKSIASVLDGIKSIFVLGAGPDMVFARESAQKIREATHVKAEGIELEEFNHGCTAVMDQDTLLIIANNAIVNERVQDIVKASREVNSRTLVINGNGDYTIEYERTGSIASDTLINVLSAYYMAYYLALRYHVNPDLLRFEDPRYLRYDSVVFPPGAH